MPAQYWTTDSSTTSTWSNVTWTETQMYSAPRYVFAIQGNYWARDLVCRIHKVSEESIHMTVNMEVERL